MKDSQRKTTSTVVIFRKWVEQDGIIALFPEEPVDKYGLDCLIYRPAPIGFGRDNPFDVQKDTRPATPEERIGLLEELMQTGRFELRVAERMSYSMFEKRRMKARGAGCV